MIYGKTVAQQYLDGLDLIEKQYHREGTAGVRASRVCVVVAVNYLNQEADT